MENIVFAEGDFAEPFVKAVGSKQAKWFCDSFNARQSLEEKGFQVKYFEEAFSSEDARETDLKALELSRNLCIFSSNDVSVFEGISLCEMNQLSSYSYFIRLLKLFVVVKNAVEAEMPKNVFVPKGSLLGKIAEIVCRKKGISVKFVSAGSDSNGNFMFLFNLKRKIIQFFSNAYLKVSNGGKNIACGKKTILFFGVLSKWGDRIFEKLEEDGFNVLVVDMNVSHRKLLKTKVCHAKLFQFSNGKGVSKIFFKKMLEIFWKENSVQNKFFFKGFDLKPAVVEKINSVFLDDFPETVEEINEISEMIGVVRPLKAVMWSDATRKERILVEVARKNMVESVVMQHGVNSGFDLVENLSFFPLFADKVMVWGKKDLDFFVERGVSGKRVFVVGCERCDYLNSVKGSLGKNARKDLGIGLNEKMVVFGTQPYNGWTSDEGKYEHHEILKTLVESAKKIGGVKIVLKPHPSEFSWAYDSIIEKNPGVVIQTSMDPYELMAAGDLVITRLSTIGLEGLVLGKPLMAINFSRRIDAFPYAMEKAALGVSEKSVLSEKLKEILFDEKFLKQLESGRGIFFENWLDGLQGRTIEKTVRVLES